MPGHRAEVAEVLEAAAAAGAKHRSASSGHLLTAATPATSPIRMGDLWEIAYIRTFRWHPTSSVTLPDFSE